MLRDRGGELQKIHRSFSNTPLPKKKGEDRMNCKEKTKHERINDEIKRLKRIFTKIEAKEKKVIEGLIQRAAYMRVTLEDYEVDLDENGYVEMFSQSEKTPPYERERPVARLYNTMNGNYQKIMKQLSNYIEKQPPIPKEEGDGFDDFVNSKGD